MHICLVNTEYPKETHFGGIATYQKLLADALVRKGYKVTVIAASSTDNQDYYEDGVHIIRILKRISNENYDGFISYRKKVSDKIKQINSKDKIDIIETPEFGAETIFVDKDKLKIPVVVKLHTSYKLWSFFNNVKHNNKIIHNEVIRIEDELLKNADQIISCSDLLRNIMKDYYDFIDIDKIKVVPNPIDINSFYPARNNHKSKTVLFCGSIEKRKGVYVLAKAIPIVLRKIKDDDIKFQFIGNYENIDVDGICAKDEIYKMIPKKYHKNIEFLGIIPNKELNKYYNEAFVGIVGSLFDNFPYVALEEMLTELPVIASNNTGVKEMIKDKKSGLLYEPEDYKTLAELIIELYNNPNKAKEMGKKARKEIIKKYSPETIVEKNIEIYKGVIYEFKR